jgi:hypothetical protein
VIAAAYENLAGAAQVHRASLALLERRRFRRTSCRRCWSRSPQIVAVDAARLGYGDGGPGAEAKDCRARWSRAASPLPEPIRLEAPEDAGARRVVALRPLAPEVDADLGRRRGLAMGSEALIAARPRAARPGMLAIRPRRCGSVLARSGVDLVAFLGGVAARASCGGEPLAPPPSR